VIWTRLFPSVRQQERERFRFFFLLAGLLVMGQTLGLVGVDSLLLSHLGAGVLPTVFVVASVSTVLTSLLYAVGVDNSRNDNYFIRLLLIFASCIAGASLLEHFVPAAKSAALVALFCLYYANFAVCTNHFWTFTGDFFDTLGSKRLFPLFTVGSSLGGLLGGLIATAVASRSGGSAALLWGWVGCTLLAAGWLRFHKGPLRRWGPLEIEEADETSMDGVRSSVRYLRNSRLGRLMVLSALFMVTSLFVSQYIYSSLFLAAYPDSDELAEFFGIFLAGANALELVLELAITPFLLRRFGIANTNLVHPLLTLVAFTMLGLNPMLGTAIFARLNRETLENALAAPVRNLIFNALPARLRGRMRAFLEGMVVYSGMAMAGLFLMLWERLNPDSVGVSAVLSGGGFLLGCAFFLTNYGMKKDYLEQLLVAIREGRVELSHSSSTLETLPSRKLVQLWKALAASSAQIPILEELSRALLERNILKPLQESFDDGDGRVRFVCLQALVSLGPVQADLYLRKALTDPSSRIRLYALRNLTPAAASLVPSLLGDPDPEVRAEAASRCLPVDEETLKDMLRSDKAAYRLAALSRLPMSLIDFARTAMDSPHPGEVQAALRTLCRFGAAPTLEQLAKLYESPVAKVRLEALRAVADGSDRPGADELELLYRGLSDQDREVRQSTVNRFVSLGALGKPMLETALGSPETHLCHSSIRALSQLSLEEARPLFGQESIRRAKRAWLHSLEAAKLESKADRNSLTEEFLVLALRDAAARDLSTCFRLLEALEEPKIVRSVEKVLRFAHARIRADALEVLSNLGIRESTAILVHLLEEGDIIERERALSGRVPPPRERRVLLAQLECCNDRWLRLAAFACLAQEGLDDEPGSQEQRREEGVLMEHLLMLQSVPLFATMTLEQLEAIHLCLTEQHYTLGELIFAEGDVGDEMYIVVDGEVEILIKLETPEPFLLATVGPGSYFGEMSILDNEPRSAAARVAKDARLLVLKGEQLKELVYVMPEIAFTIFKVLSERLRRSDKRLDSLVRERKEEVNASSGGA
jgi:ATP/ADP translocase